MSEEWKPLSEVPEAQAVHINLRTPDGAVNSYRWLPYRKGSQQPYVGGRWQAATEHGWKNQPLPTEGEFVLNPARRIG